MTVYINSTGITVDTVPLNTVCRAVESKSGRLVTAPARGANPVVAGRSGSIWSPDKPQDEGRFVLPMWVLGCDDNGTVPGGSSKLIEFYKNKEMLQRVLTKRYALLDIQATQPDATVRKCLAECTAVVDFQMFNPDSARINAEFIIPSVYWEDLTTFEVSSAGLAANGTMTGGMTGGTAPIDDAILVVAAVGNSITNPRLTDDVTGRWVQYNGVLAAGSAWRINSATWSSRTGVAYLASEADDKVGTTNVVGSTTKSAQTRLLSLTPNPLNAATTVRITGTFGGGATATLTFRGKRKYHS